MEVDAWSEWAGSAAQPPVPPGPADLEDLHDLVVTRAARLAGTEHALLWLADDDSARLVVRRGTGHFSSAVGRALGRGEGLAGEVWQAGRAQAATGLRGLGAALCVPLAAGASVVGVLRVAWSEPGRRIDQVGSELLCGWGELAGAVLDRAGRPRARAGCPGRPSTTGPCPSRSRRCSTARSSPPPAPSSTRAPRTSSCSATRPRRPCSRTSGRR